MSIAKLNNEYVKFTHETPKDLEYKTLEMLFNEHGSEKVHIVWGAYINDGKYGKQGLLVTDECYVNVPNHLTSDIETIRTDESMVNQINKGQAGFTIYNYFSRKYNKNCFSLNWVDIKPDLEEY